MRLNGRLVGIGDHLVVKDTGLFVGHCPITVGDVVRVTATHPHQFQMSVMHYGFYYRVCEVAVFRQAEFYFDFCNAITFNPTPKIFGPHIMDFVPYKTVKIATFKFDNWAVSGRGPKDVYLAIAKKYPEVTKRDDVESLFISGVRVHIEKDKGNRWREIAGALINLFPEPIYRIGDKFVRDDASVIGPYTLCQVGDSMVCFVGAEGNRWANPFKVKDSYRITTAELQDKGFRRTQEYGDPSTAVSATAVSTNDGMDVNRFR